MAEMIRVYEPTEIEYMKLRIFANFTNIELDKLGDEQHKVTIDDIYFDYGQGWKYTGLLTEKNDSCWQSVCPRDYELILLTDSISKLQEMAKWYANKLVNNGSWRDVMYEVFEG